MSETSSRGVSTDLLRRRVRLYLSVLLAIDIGFHLWAAISVLTGLEPDERPADIATIRVFRFIITGLLVASLAYVRYRKPPRSALVAIETGGTVVLALVYVHLSTALPVYGPAFSVLMVSLALVLRSALVPSSVARTSAVAAIALAASATAGLQHAEGTPPIVVSWLTVMGLAFGAVSAVISKVIYGLQRQVRVAQRLGQYELIRKIGEGGMGVVYQATHVMLRRPTAVKLLPLDRAGEQTVLRFEREVRQTSRLEHPNSVYIYDYGRTPDGQFYYAMELLDGLNLAQLVDRDGAIAPARVHSILLQSARALSEAHDLGLVHRDIKPANIMLCSRGGEPDSVKVLDFGLVKQVDDSDDAEVTQANTVLGTPSYMSPEAIRAPSTVGPAADVYALGAIGFYLLTGRPVFEGESVIDVCARHLNDTPESPSAVRGSAIAPELEQLVLDCLSKNAESRPADGGALVAALEEIEIAGWSRSDARAWWDDYRDIEREPVQPAPSSERTQLAVDVDARSP